MTLVYACEAQTFTVQGNLMTRSTINQPICHYHLPRQLIMAI